MKKLYDILITRYRLYLQKLKEKEFKMLTILFLILMFLIFGKLFLFALKASWGIVKILFTVVLLPLVLVGLLFAGLMTLAFPLLIVGGIISLFVFHA